MRSPNEIKNASIIASSCCIIINLILFFMNREPNPDTSIISEHNSTKSPLKENKAPSVLLIEPEYQSFFQIIEKHTDLLFQALENDKLISSFASTSGYEIKPFGLHRLKILEIIGLLVKIGVPCNFAAILCKNRVFEKIFVRLPLIP